MQLLERYVLRECLFPFFLGFGVSTFVLIFQFLFGFLDLLVGKGIPFLVVLKLFLLALGWIVALSVPCGVLVGSLMTFGRLSQDNEITAFRACGVNLSRVIRPVFLAALFVATLLALFNNYILPDTNHMFANLSLAINRKSPAARIREGVFITDFPDRSLIVGHVDNKTGFMRDITIYDFSQSDIPVTILAETGHLTYSEDGATLRFDLNDGEIHEVPPDGDVNKYRRIAFQHHTLLLHNADAVLEDMQRDSRSEREMDIPELNRQIRRFEASHAQRESLLVADLDSLGFSDYATFQRKVLPPPRGMAGLVERARLAVAGIAGQKADTARVSILEQDKERLYMASLDITNLEKRMNSYRVEVHKKFSIPFACLVFVLLGAPIGMKARRGGIAASALSIGFFLVYYLFLIGGEQLAERTIVSPAVAMWAPNVVLAIPALWMTWNTVRGRDIRP